MKSAVALLLMCFLFAFETPLTLSGTNPKLRVQVLVSSDNMKNTIESFMNRELRSLGDVEISYSEPQWTINVVHLKLAVNGMFTGHALSVVATKAIASQSTNKYAAPIDALVHHVLCIGGTDDLRERCQMIVAGFDSSELEPYRQVNKNVR